tara:strand:- start:679 stop:1059 length:381 start_codon:yes stop_codon:yes gene_type:complete
MVRRTRKTKRMMGGKAGFKNLVGTRAEVMHGTAYKTSYGAVKPAGDALTKAHLKYNKHGRIVSKAKSAKKDKLLKQLRDAGYTTKKGKFGAVKTGTRKKRRTKRRRRKGKRCRHKTGRKKGKFKKC